MSPRLDSRALVAAAFALVLAACVIGPKPDDPLNGGDGTAVPDAGADDREIADVGVVPNADAGLVLDAPGSGLGDAGGDAADAPGADALGDVADGGADGGADDAPSHGGDAAALDGADDADGGPG